MIAVALAATPIAVGCRSPSPANSAPTASFVAGSPAVEPNATLVDVVDGDTIDVRIGGRDERVRLIGIDTPETKKPDSPVECFGPEATAFTSSLLAPGTPLRIERDVVGRDHYGRLLGYVYRADDGLFVNDAIIRGGFATPLTIEPNSLFAADFVDAADEAERLDLGMWAACG
jgi:micrococcal nuclease